MHGIVWEEAEGCSLRDTCNVVETVARDGVDYGAQALQTIDPPCRETHPANFSGNGSFDEKASQIPDIRHDSRREEIPPTSLGD